MPYRESLPSNCLFLLVRRALRGRAVIDLAGRSVYPSLRCFSRERLSDFGMAAERLTPPRRDDELHAAWDLRWASTQGGRPWPQRIRNCEFGRSVWPYLR